MRQGGFAAIVSAMTATRVTPSFATRSAIAAGVGAHVAAGLDAGVGPGDADESVAIAAAGLCLLDRRGLGRGGGLGQIRLGPLGPWRRGGPLGARPPGRPPAGQRARPLSP